MREAARPPRQPSTDVRPDRNPAPPTAHAHPPTSARPVDQELSVTCEPQDDASLLINGACGAGGGGGRGSVGGGGRFYQFHQDAAGVLRVYEVNAAVRGAASRGLEEQPHSPLA